MDLAILLTALDAAMASRVRRIRDDPELFLASNVRRETDVREFHMDCVAACRRVNEEETGQLAKPH